MRNLNYVTCSLCFSVRLSKPDTKFVRSSKHEMQRYKKFPSYPLILGNLASVERIPKNYLLILWHIKPSQIVDLIPCKMLKHNLISC